MAARKVQETVTLRDETVLDDEAEAIARERGVTISALAREALEQFVGNAG